MTKTSEKKPVIEIIVAIVLAVLAIGTFVWQIINSSSTTTKLETSLFSLMQFLLTVGFAWFSSRAISRAEFRGELRHFAISAYRRISDISQMITRLERHLDSMPDELVQHAPQLAGVQAIVGDTSLALKSATADWADIIGDELTKLREIVELRSERRHIESGRPMINRDDVIAELAAVNDKIESLVKELPPSLQLEQAREEERLTEEIADWIANEHEQADGFELFVIGGPGYPCSQDPTTFEPDKELFVSNRPDEPMDVQDRTGMVLGRVLNKSPASYNVFQEALVLCYGTDLLHLKFDGVVGLEDGREGNLTKYRVAIQDRPFPDVDDADLH